MAKKSKQKVRGGKRATQVKTDVDLKDETSENGEEEQQQEQWDMIEFVRGKRPDLICRSDGCEAMAVSIWKSNLKINSDDEWPTCEGCQDEHFGGWPEDFDPESPLVADGTEQDAAERQEPMTQPDTDANTNTRASDESPTEPQSIEVQQPSIDDNTKDGECDATDNDESKAEEVLWDLKKIMSIAEVTHECPIKCSHETCSLPAASIWVSTEKPTDNWYSCLDCQVSSFCISSF